MFMCAIRSYARTCKISFRAVAEGSRQARPAGAGLPERRLPRQCATEYQGVDLIRTLVGAHRLQVRHVPHDGEVGRDAVTAENRAALPRNRDGLAHVVQFADADLLVA